MASTLVRAACPHDCPDTCALHVTVQAGRVIRVAGDPKHPPTQGVLRAALNALLSVKDQFYGESGLYNPLYQSNLQVGDVTIEGGQAIIHLTGTLMMGGECDIPRVEAQLTEIALQFSTVTSVAVFINDIPLKDVLSLK